ncbi:MAG: CDP-diacylglycerol--glycerol-3-phosphate 3-phosphatidyltransferase [Clostridia bacterium]|nr:CDP-diacylglycerol--glycerol-3-phosphate 3-phosphatidyltransferase [Clostridia bacterium]
MNLANKLTVFRIILVIVMIIINFFNFPGELIGIPTKSWILLIIFTIASITDKLDGHIARSRNQITTFGKFLDPIADKILVITTLVILVENQKIPAWIPIIIILREFVVSGYRLIAVEQGGEVIAANIWGKLKTVTQMIATIFALVDTNKFADVFTKQMDIIPFLINLGTTVLMVACVIATIFSGITYLKGSKKILKDM